LNFSDFLHRAGAVLPGLDSEEIKMVKNCLAPTAPAIHALTRSRTGKESGLTPRISGRARNLRCTEQAILRAPLHAVAGRLVQELQALLFLSSQIMGSHNSTLFPSGSMIHANFPFS
jgi:hypothetical protein